MRNLIIALLFSVGLSAQTFDFSCNREPINETPLLASAYVQWITDTTPWTGYIIIRYSANNNILRQMSVISAVDGENITSNNLSLLAGEHIYTVATELSYSGVTLDALENSNKEDVRVDIYDCGIANDPISLETTYTVSGSVLRINVNELPNDVNTWTLNVYTATNAVQYYSNGTSRYYMGNEWVSFQNELIFPNFTLPDDIMLDPRIDPSFYYGTTLCNYNRSLRNTFIPEFPHSWVETSIGIWTSELYPEFHLSGLNSYRPNRWSINVYRNGEIMTRHSGYSYNYSFDHFLSVIENYVKRTN